MDYKSACYPRSLPLFVKYMKLRPDSSYESQERAEPTAQAMLLQLTRIVSKE
jgi:hypothetical protein